MTRFVYTHAMELKARRILRLPAFSRMDFEGQSEKLRTGQVDKFGLPDTDYCRSWVLYQHGYRWNGAYWVPFHFFRDIYHDTEPLDDEDKD